MGEEENTSKVLNLFYCFQSFNFHNALLIISPIQELSESILDMCGVCKKRKLASDDAMYDHMII